MGPRVLRTWMMDPATNSGLMDDEKCKREKWKQEHLILSSFPRLVAVLRSPFPPHGFFPGLCPSFPFLRFVGITFFTVVVCSAAACICIICSQFWVANWQIVSSSFFPCLIQIGVGNGSCWIHNNVERMWKLLTK